MLRFTDPINRPVDPSYDHLLTLVLCELFKKYFREKQRPLNPFVAVNENIARCILIFSLRLDVYERRLNATKPEENVRNRTR